MLRPSALSLVAALAFAATSLAACSSSTDSGKSGPTASATLHDVSGSTVGTVSLAEQADGTVNVDVTVHGLSAGNHGIHVHTLGQCDASTAFGSAGTHFNPTSKQHGLNNPNGAHGGDLPNITVAADGTGSLHTTTRRLTLTTGALDALDADGSAIVIHAGEDDQVTDPYGNSGTRVACGVLQPNLPD